MKRYKLIYFVPDPFTMGRIPVGALVEDGPRVESVIASHLPGAECLGGHKSAALLRMIVRDLAHVTTFELPRSISPHAKLDLEQTLAPQIENPIAWVKQHVLPCKPKQIDGLQDEKLRDPLVRRATIGYKFFQNWRVHQHVRRTFKPGRDWDNWLEGGKDVLEPISHWVAGEQEILLMEPIVPEDLHHRVDDEVKDISRRFLTYRGYVEKHRPDGNRRGRLVAYILPGVSRELRVRAFARLDVASDEVVDLSAEKDRTRFFDRIRALGEQVPSQQLLS